MKLWNVLPFPYRKSCWTISIDCGEMIVSACIKLVFKISLFNQTPTGGWHSYISRYSCPRQSALCCVIWIIPEEYRQIYNITQLRNYDMTTTKHNTTFPCTYFVWYTGSIFSLSVVLNDFILMHTLLNSLHLWYQRYIHLNSCYSLLNDCIEIITSELYYAIQFQTFITTTDSHIIHVLGLK